jgi:hypothetical protein
VRPISAGAAASGSEGEAGGGGGNGVWDGGRRGRESGGGGKDEVLRRLAMGVISLHSLSVSVIENCYEES